MTAPVSPSAPVELLPCPFCGSELSVSAEDIDCFIGHVECSGCDMRGPISEWKYEDPEEAKAAAAARWSAAWSRLAASPAPSMVGLRETLMSLPPLLLAVRALVTGLPDDVVEAHADDFNRVSEALEAIPLDGLRALLAREGV